MDILKRNWLYIKLIVFLMIFIINLIWNNVFKIKTIRIMPIGDSITDGGKTEGSYRKYLYNSLIKRGYSIKMLGPKLSNKKFKYKYQGKTLIYMGGHCGYSGYTIKDNEIKKGIYEVLTKNKYLNKYKPNLVLLMIGTNDIMINAMNNIDKRLKELIMYIYENIDKNSIILVSSILPLNPNYSIEVRNWFKYHQTNKKGEKLTDSIIQKNIDNLVIKYNNLKN